MHCLWTLLQFQLEETPEWQDAIFYRPILSKTAKIVSVTVFQLMWNGFTEVEFYECMSEGGFYKNMGMSWHFLYQESLPCLMCMAISHIREQKRKQQCLRAHKLQDLPLVFYPQGGR